MTSHYHYDTLWSVAGGVLTLVGLLLFGSMPGIVIGVYITILLSRFVYAARLARDGAVDADIEAVNGSGRFVTPVAAVVTLAILVYGLVIYWLGARAPSLWLSLPTWETLREAGSPSAPLAFEGRLPADIPAAAAQRFLMHLHDLSIVGAAVFVLLSTVQLARGWSAGWRVSGVLINSAVATPFRYCALMFVRLMLILLGLGLLAITDGAMATADFESPGLAGPRLYMADDGARSLPFVQTVSVIAAIASAVPFLTSMLFGLVAMILLRAREDYPAYEA